MNLAVGDQVVKALHQRCLGHDRRDRSAAPDPVPMQIAVEGRTFDGEGAQVSQATGLKGEHLLASPTVVCSKLRLPRSRPATVETFIAIPRR